MTSFSRTDIVAVTRSWLGTPYHHQQSLKGVGTDCLGLVRGVWRELLGSEPEIPPPYTPDWADASGDETLLHAARRHLVEIAPCEMKPGDILLFRYRRACVAKHLGILVAPHTLIHAAEGQNVTEVPLTRWWTSRIVAAFAIPGVAT